MKNVMYFILSLASLLVLACVGYVGLSNFIELPAVEIITNIGAPYVLSSTLGTLDFWTCLPLLIMTLFAFFNFFGRNLKIILFIVLILVIALDVVVLFFPDVIVQIMGK
ncbi:MAG: hypothetical protein IKT27_06865 [Clostridia bacterium]|nr:hypothetical protein [Clostridia bacterium]